MLFNLILGLLMAAAVVVALAPLVLKSSGHKTSHSHRQAQLEIYAQRVKELEVELDAGDLSQADFDTALADLEREIAESGGLAEEQEQAKFSQSKPWLAIVASLLVPVLAFSVYSKVGMPRAADAGFQARNQAQPNQNQGQHGSGGMDETEQFYQLAEHLQQRLMQTPDDVESWVLLARTLVFLEHFPEGAKAYERAYEQGANADPRMLASYADVLAQVQGGFAGRPSELIQEALNLDANHGMALWLAGTAAFQMQDWDKAEKHWQHLISVLPPDSEDVQILRTNLQQLETRRQQ